MTPFADQVCAHCATTLRVGASFCQRCAKSTETSLDSSGDSKSVRFRRLLLVVGATFTTALLSGLIPWESLSPLGADIATLTTSFILSAVTIALAVRTRRELRPMFRLGPWKSTLPWTGFGVLTGCGVMAAMMGLLSWLGAAFWSDRLEALPLWVSVFLFAVVTPIEEEILFRGIVQNDLERLFGVRMGLALQAVVFGTVHLAPLAYFTHTLFGLLLGFLRLRTRSLWPGVVVHGLWNLYVVLG